MRVWLLILLGVVPCLEASRLRLNINEEWRFHRGDPVGEPQGAGFDDSKWERVMVPHSHRIFSADVREFPEHGREHGWYRRRINIPREWTGKKVFVEFQGAMQKTKAWLNGEPVGEYAVSGFDSFHFDLSSKVKPGENVLTLLVDNRVDPKLPPDGVSMDFLLFGGLYRDVFLHVTDPLHITFPWEERQAGVRVTYPEISDASATIQVETAIQNSGERGRDFVLETEIRDPSGKVVLTLKDSKALGAVRTFLMTQMGTIENPKLWSPDEPALYRVVTRLTSGGTTVDELENRTGVRWVRFDSTNGFFLNGKPLKLIGVNRHQSWPFIGFAVPNNLHRFDAKQIKEMGANWVRLSHYPHDPDFLDALDELGLMALAEGPTWNMVSGEHEWMRNLEASFRRMIRRDRNHPSIIIWNACINHHGRHAGLAEAAAEEDPTRERGQDTVPTPMDFRHRQVSKRGALSVEHTGHTFPGSRGAQTGGKRGKKKFFSETALALRHAEHTDAVLAEASHSGSAAWAMYDYNTLRHTDEPGIAWHGIADIFRLPKLSFHWHQSEFNELPTIQVCPPAAGEMVVFSNAERVELWTGAGPGARKLAESERSDQLRVSGTNIGTSLRRPPFRFTIDGNPEDIRAVGIWKDESKRESLWRATSPRKMDVSADTNHLERGSITRIIATVSEGGQENGNKRSEGITFVMRGSGELIGENPAAIRAGKAVILYKGVAAGTAEISGGDTFVNAGVRVTVK